MKLNFFFVTLKTDYKVNLNTTKFRGFIANKFSNDTLLHQHEGKGFVYLYPRVQYKVLDGKLAIIGINEGVETLKEIHPEIDYLDLGGERYKIIDKKIDEKDVEFGANSSFRPYHLLAPWLALNEKNYERYRSSNKKEQTQLLNRILIGNILSMAKSLEYVVTSEIKAKTNVRPVPVKLKGVPMTGFIGDFQVNFNLPDYIGLGKSVSRGFGAVRRVGEVRSDSYDRERQSVNIRI
jgi:hypothetical protein